MARANIFECIEASDIAKALIESGLFKWNNVEIVSSEFEELVNGYQKYVQQKEVNRIRQKKHWNKTKYEKIENVEQEPAKEDEQLEVSDQTQEQKPKTEPKPKKPKAAKITGYTEDFEAFWQAYPRKADKGACYEKYKARLKDGYKPEQLKTAAERYRQQCESSHTELAYIKHGKTFLGRTLPFVEYIGEDGQKTDYVLQHDPSAHRYTLQQAEPYVRPENDVRREYKPLTENPFRREAQ